MADLVVDSAPSQRGLTLHDPSLYTNRELSGHDELYLGSADLMERNLNRRVEAVARVLDRAIVRHVRDVVLDSYLRDSDAAYTLEGDRYTRAVADAADARVNAQQELLAWYTLRPSAADAAD